MNLTDGRGAKAPTEASGGIVGLGVGGAGGGGQQGGCGRRRDQGGEGTPPHHRVPPTRARIAPTWGCVSSGRTPSHQTASCSSDRWGLGSPEASAT